MLVMNHALDVASNSGAFGSGQVFFDQEWKRITGFLSIDKPWRYVINGRCVNPDWPIHGFLHEESDQEIKIFMMLGLHGGGPIDLKEVADVRSGEMSGNMSHMADFETENFEAALAHALKHLVDQGLITRDVDITCFLELENGLMCITGPFETLRSLLDVFIRKGVERTLAFCGWMVACHLKFGV